MACRWSRLRPGLRRGHASCPWSWLLARKGQLHSRCADDVPAPRHTACSSRAERPSTGCTSYQCTCRLCFDHAGCRARCCPARRARGAGHSEAAGAGRGRHEPCGKEASAAAVRSPHGNSGQGQVGCRALYIRISLVGWTAFGSCTTPEHGTPRRQCMGGCQDARDSCVAVKRSSSSGPRRWDSGARRP